MQSTNSKYGSPYLAVCHVTKVTNSVNCWQPCTLLKLRIIFRKVISGKLVTSTNIKGLKDSCQISCRKSCSFYTEHTFLCPIMSHFHSVYFTVLELCPYRCTS